MILQGYLDRRQNAAHAAGKVISNRDK
jgi:hypothetical protein